MSSVAEYKEFQPENVVGYVRALPVRQGLIGDGILPLKTVDDMTSIWQELNVKVTAGHLLALDSEIPMDAPPGIKEISQALAKIGKKRVIKEEEKVKLFKPRPGTADIQTATDYVYNVLRLLSEGVDDRVECLRWAALGDGSYTYDKYGIKISVSWGIPGANQKTAAPKWSDLENSDPLQDIIDWNNILIAATGGSAVVAYLSSKVMGYLLQNMKIRNLIGYSQTGRGEGFPSRRQVSQFLLMGEGLPLRIYDAAYNDEAMDGTITRHRFLTEEKFIMLSSAEGLSPMGLGDVADGPVPDNGMEPGKFADFYVEKEPYREIARAIQFAFPRIYAPGCILQATVHS
ncbi:hypothetical protein ES702_05565 [subsurface metagenome]